MHQYSMRLCIMNSAFLRCECRPAIHRFSILLAAIIAVRKHSYRPIIFLSPTANDPIPFVQPHLNFASRRRQVMNTAQPT
jgi:hypothetical protein